MVEIDDEILGWRTVQTKKGLEYTKDNDHGTKPYDKLSPATITRVIPLFLKVELDSTIANLGEQYVTGQSFCGHAQDKSQLP